jgi:hypothetical protein
VLFCAAYDRLESRRAVLTMSSGAPAERPFGQQARAPSYLISCSHASPEGGCGAELGRHGAMKPAGRVRECRDIGAVNT